LVVPVLNVAAQFLRAGCVNAPCTTTAWDALRTSFDVMAGETGMAEGEYRQGQRALIVQRAAEPAAVAPHPLVGAGVHFMDQYGRVQDHAAIVAVVPSNNTAVGDLALLQYFERARGAPPTQRLIPLAELSSSDRWVLYKSVAEMIWVDSQQKAQEAATLTRMIQSCGPQPETRSSLPGNSTSTIYAAEDKPRTVIS
jgi:hypothetical protein